MCGEVDENRKLSYRFIKLDDTEFVCQEQNVDKLESKEDVIEKMNQLELDEDKLYEIILVGKREFEINPREILKLVENPNILKIKNNTSFKYDLEKIKNEKTLRGLFVKEMLKKQSENIASEEEIKKAIEIGLNALKE